MIIKNKNLIRVDAEFYDYIQAKKDMIRKNNPNFPVDISTPKLTKLIAIQLKRMEADRKQDKRRLMPDMDFLKW